MTSADRDSAALRARRRLLPIGLLTTLAAFALSAQESSAPSAADLTLEAEPCVSQPGEGPEMVLIEGGRFRMGAADDDAAASLDERPDHEVGILKPFALARCETRVGEFRLFVDETGYRTDAERGGCNTIGGADGGLARRDGTDWDDPGFEQSDSHPVVCVSHRDASAYGRWLSLRTGAEYRLPSEAEWEYAARAGEPGPAPWQSGADVPCAHANGADRTAKVRFDVWTVTDCSDGALFTAPAGSYRRSAFGLSDIIGNVAEWVEDCWHDSYADAPAKGDAWLETAESDCERRIVRGGSWRAGPAELRAAERAARDRAEPAAFVGIRLARTIIREQSSAKLPSTPGRPKIEPQVQEEARRQGDAELWPADDAKGDGEKGRLAAEMAPQESEQQIKEEERRRQAEQAEERRRRAEQEGPQAQENARLTPKEREDRLALTSAQRSQVQTALNALGFDTGPVDGVFGPRTRKALTAYQRDAGLAATGYLTAPQRDKLAAAVKASRPKKRSTPSRSKADGF